MTAEPRRRPSRHPQRRIHRRQAIAAVAVEAEWARGQRYLADPSVPAEVATRGPQSRAHPARSFEYKHKAAAAPAPNRIQWYGKGRSARNCFYSNGRFSHGAHIE